MFTKWLPTLGYMSTDSTEFTQGVTIVNINNNEFSLLKSSNRHL